MARKKGKSNPEQTVIDYRHEDAKRKNIPPAGLAAQGKIREKPKIQYAYNPHLLDFVKDPLSAREFHEGLQNYRVDRLLEKYPRS